MLDILPIVKSLWRNKTGPLLIILQLSLTVAVVSNALHVVNERLDKIARPSGIAEKEIFKIWVRRNSSDVDIQAVAERDMDIIRATPGVIDATPISSIPMSGSGSSSALRKSREDKIADFPSAIFEVTHHGLAALGLNLIEGRNFNEGEINFFTRDNPPDHSVAIITKHIAEQMFPDESAVGKTVYMGPLPLTIVGVVERLMGPWPSSDTANNVTLLPVIVKEDSINYLVRARQEERDSIMHALVEKLASIDNTRQPVDEKSWEDIKRDVYTSDYAMIKILAVVIFMLTFVNALGIFGLTTFWVNQRRKQIGIRRALGSTKAGVMRYFMLENVVLVLIAAIVGTTIAYVDSSYMARTQGTALLPFQYVPISVLFLLFITLLAAFSPIWKAMRISPVEAVANN